MRTAARIASATGAVVIAAAGYVTLDVYDVVPGFLTRQDAPRPAVAVNGTIPTGAAAQPPTAPTNVPAVALANGPSPEQSAVAAAVRKALTNPKFTGAKYGIEVRDGTTGQPLFAQNIEAALTPASVTKLLSSWAIAHTMNPEQTFTTKVVDSSNAITLVAGGDTVLSPGKGNPNAVVGHAGLGDLAAQVAAALKQHGRTSVTVNLDTSYAPGALTAPKWTPDLLAMGYTARIAQLGLSTQRSEPPKPAAADPARSVLNALITQLKAHGITATAGSNTAAPGDATVLGSVTSAPLVDVLGQAMQDSDNAMIESLTRQAAFAKGVPGAEESVTNWVESTLTAGGFNLAGVKLQDACGLSVGTTIPVRVLSDLLAAGTSGKDPKYTDVLSRLATGGWNGTLHDRFLRPSNVNAAGLARAKTGSLTGVSSLAGTVVDAHGRLLSFAMIVNRPQGMDVYGTRAAIDDVVAALAKL